jgi:hypothetical protein
MLFQVLLQVVERLVVGVHALLLRIGHEYHAVNAAQYELAAGVIEDLSGNGVEMEPRAEAANAAQIQWQEIEEQGAFGFRGQRDHLALLPLAGTLVDKLQIRGFAAQTGAVVDDLAIDLASGEVDKTQVCLELDVSGAAFAGMTAASRRASSLPPDALAECCSFYITPRPK